MSLKVGEIYEFGPFRLEVAERRLLREGEPVRLRTKVFDTLHTLVARHGRLVDKDELMRAVWPDTVVEENNLAHNITALRKVLGEHSGEKFIETVSGKGYRFIAAVKAGQAPVRQAAAPAALLEREAETSALNEALQAALTARRQVVCISGESGIGKTALLDAFLQSLPFRDVWSAQGQCVEHVGEGEAYMPVLEAIGRLCRLPEGGEIVSLLSRFAPTWMLHMPWLVDEAGFAALRERTLGVNRERMLREMAEAIEELTARRPLILALEDLHWADPSTIGLLGMLARRSQPARLLLIGTYRGVDGGAAGRALESLVQDLQLRGRCTLIRPPYLSETAVDRIVGRRLPGIRLPPEWIGLVRQRSSGNPLFVHALAGYWKATGAVVAEGGQWRVRDSHDRLVQGVPDSLRAMIQRELDRLSREDLELVECAAVQGAQFTCASIAAALDKDERQIEMRCSWLARENALFREEGLSEMPDGSATAGYGFAHSLYQATVYERVPPSARTRLHLRIGEHLENACGSRSAARAVELVHHFIAAREPRRAVPYLLSAAESALRRSAHREAVAHLRRGLHLLDAWPPTPDRESWEFRFRAMLAPSLIVLEGFSAAEADDCFARAREIGERLGDASRMHPLLFDLAFMHELRGEYQRSEALLKERLQLAGPEHGESVVLDSDALMACSLFHQGEFSRSLKRARHGIGLYDPGKHVSLIASYGENPGVACQGWAALSLWFLGFPDQAVERVRAAISLSEAPNHLYSLSGAQLHAAQLHQFRREAAPVREWAAAALALSEAQGYPYNAALAKVFLGWAEAVGSASGQGIHLVQQGLASARAIGAEMDRPYLLALLAEAEAASGLYREALDLLAEALAQVRNSRAFFYEPELYRLKATLMLQIDGRTNTDDAEANLRLAIEVARRQQAKSLELRAAVNLGHLLKARGRRKEARSLLEPIYSWFQEGFQTADLKNAKAILNEEVASTGTI